MREDSITPLVFEATFGVNEVIVKAHDLVKQQFPAHAGNVTVYGRMLAKHTIINVDFELNYDPKVWLAVDHICLPDFLTDVFTVS